jgi:porin
MKQLWAYVCVIGLWVGGMAWAQLPQIEDYGGDLWSRPALTGDWGGLRNTLATKGINLDVDLVQSLQGLNSSGLANDSVLYRYGGHAEYLLHVDTGKLGLWPGGFLRLKGESQFGPYL